MILEILLLLIFNLLIGRTEKETGDRRYRIELKRIERALLDGETVNADDYEYVTAVVPFGEGYRTDYDYAVVNANGSFYSIEYINTEKSNARIYMNLFFISVFVLTAALLLYLGQKILKPFNRLTNYSMELAKGNLSRPVKAERNKYFGKFLWGMDMLRDNLETGKKKELELQKDKKTLILSISHDIKTPLSAIRLYTKALKENVYDSEETREEALAHIDKNVDEIEHHVSDIVRASKEDFLNLSVNMGEYYQSSILNRIETIYREKLASLHIAFEIPKYEDCLLKCDSDRLEEVLQNILENAIKYGDGRYIRITVDEEEDCRLIAVTNSGCSAKEEELAHLFSSFYRGSNSEQTEGSGLGLYIAKTLMHMMAGEVYAKINGEEFTAVTVVRMV